MGIEGAEIKRKVYQCAVKKQLAAGNGAYEDQTQITKIKQTDPITTLTARKTQQSRSITNL